MREGDGHAGHSGRVTTNTTKSTDMDSVPALPEHLEPTFRCANEACPFFAGDYTGAPGLSDEDGMSPSLQTTWSAAARS